MSNVAKINNDLESRRLQRNMTDTQKKNSNNVKEGKIINSFVKDPLLSLDETIDTLVISQERIELPQKVFEEEEKKNNSLLKIGGAAIGSMALIGGFTGMIKNFSQKKYQSSQEYLLPGITRNHCINDEIHQGIFSMIQSPNRKTILSCIGVISLSATAFLAKTFIDGYRDVWVKKKEADIQKNLQENLIEVETQAFSGKIQIIRSMLSTKAQEFSKVLNEKHKRPTFTSNEKTKKEEENKQQKWILPALGAINYRARLSFCKKS